MSDDTWVSTPVSPDEWLPVADDTPHDHKGHSEEKCIRCGWVMGMRPLNCMNDDTPHRFPSQAEAADEIERLRKAGDALAHGIRTGQWDDALDAWTELRDE